MGADDRRLGELVKNVILTVGTFSLVRTAIPSSDSDRMLIEDSPYSPTSSLKTSSHGSTPTLAQKQRQSKRHSRQAIGYKPSSPVTTEKKTSTTAMRTARSGKGGRDMTSDHDYKTFN